MFSIEGSQSYNKSETEEFTRSLFPCLQDVFSVNVYCTPCFPLMLLQDVSTLYDLFVLDESAYASMDERTKRSPTAKLLLWMWFVLFKRNVGKDMFSMLGSYYEANNLSFYGKPSRGIPSTTEQAVKEVPIMVAASNAHPQVNISDSQNRVQYNDQELQQWNQRDNTKRATAVLQYFRDRYFNGDKKQSTSRVNRDYEVCAAKFHLFDAGKAAYFVNALDSPARDFYFDNCRITLWYNEIVVIMKREYESPTRQATIQAKLEFLRFGPFMARNKITSQSEGLEKLVHEINTLSSQAPLSFRDKDHKIRCLRRALLDVPWAQSATGIAILNEFHLQSISFKLTWRATATRRTRLCSFNCGTFPALWKAAAKE